jgi:transposase InsO family protein
VLYGAASWTAWLARTGFPGVSKHTVDRLMRQEDMRGLVRGRKVRTTIAAKDGRRAQDLLHRHFSTAVPNRAWVTDFTYVPTWSGSPTWRSRSTCTRGRCVGWSASHGPKTSRSLSPAWRWRCGGAITLAGQCRPG